MHYAYPYEMNAQPDGGFVVSFPDVPEAITQGETEAEAAAMAEDALVTALSFYADDGEPLPHPSPAEGRRLAYVPPLAAAKLALHESMLACRVSNVLLARRLGVDEKIVRRLRDPLHKSRIDQVAQALQLLGRRIGIVVRELSSPEQRDASLQMGRLGSLADARVRPKAKMRDQLLCTKLATRRRQARNLSRSRPIARERCRQKFSQNWVNGPR